MEMGLLAETFSEKDRAITVQFHELILQKLFPNSVNSPQLPLNCLTQCIDRAPWPLRFLGKSSKAECSLC